MIFLLQAQTKLEESNKTYFEATQNDCRSPVWRYLSLVTQLGCAFWQFILQSAILSRDLGGGGGGGGLAQWLALPDSAAPCSIPGVHKIFQRKNC